VGSTPGSSPILGHAAGCGARWASRPFGAVVESARRAGLERLAGRSPSACFSGASGASAVGQRLGRSRLGRVLGRSACCGSGASSNGRPRMGATGGRIRAGSSVLGRAFRRAGLGTSADRRARCTSRSVVGSASGLRRTRGPACHSRAATLEFARAGLVGRCGG